MASTSLKSRPRSLKKRSIASSHLPTIHRHFSKSGVAHHEVVDVDSMSGTNKLITSAFKDLKIIGSGERPPPVPVKECGGSMAREWTGGDGECSILTGGVLGENPLATGGPLILREDGHTFDCAPEQSLLKTPQSIRELTLGRNNMSSSSIDSGVYSLRGSKRPSFEEPSPADTLQSEHSLQQRSRTMSGKRSTPTVHIDDTTTKRRTSRLSVDEKAFSELLQAATKLVLDAHPHDDKPGLHSNNLYLKNSLQYYKRRKSEWDLAGLKPQHEKEKLSRKKSAEPILQRIPARSSTADSKKMSACIICERNKRVNDNVCSSILIKTSMARTMQERRRFSEVLKIYKPGDLPFTEFVLPKICQLKTPADSPRDEEATSLKDRVDDNMPTFVRLTNWNSLYAHLVSKRLLDAHMREYMLNASNTHQEKGNKFYGEHMPTHGNSGYQRLLLCYQEESDHCGHETLARFLEGSNKTLHT